MASNTSSTIANALGLGYGINSSDIVTNLVAAARGPKQSILRARQNTNNAQISALANAMSALGTFSKALNETLKSTGYTGKPVSANPSIASVSRLDGGMASTGLPAELEIRQLARSQVLKSLALPQASAAVGLGTLALTTSSGSFDLVIGEDNNSLSGLAIAINAANAGVNAMVVTDSNGARLVVKGKDGAAEAFTLSAGENADSDLQRFTWDGSSNGMTLTRSAQNALILLDGVELQSAGNSIEGVIPYVKIDLLKAEPGNAFTISAEQPTGNMRTLLKEYVDAYNKLRTAINQISAAGVDGASGAPLVSDGGIRTMKRELSSMTSALLVPTGTYRTLADLGIKTGRDGILTLDSKKLDDILAADPEAVTNLINPSVKTGEMPGLDGLLSKISDTLQGKDGALIASKAKLEKMKAALAAQAEKLDKDMASYEVRLSAAFSGMDTRLAKYKSAQSYMEQQSAMWNSSKNR